MPHRLAPEAETDLDDIWYYTAKEIRNRRPAYLLTRERFRNHAKWFEAFAERGRVVELSGPHDLIASNPREVLQQIEAFASSLREKP